MVLSMLYRLVLAVLKIFQQLYKIFEQLFQFWATFEQLFGIFLSNFLAFSEQNLERPRHVVWRDSVGVESSSSGLKSE